LRLTDHSDEIIEEALRSGRFNDASEIVGEGLRLLEERELACGEPSEAEKLEWLRAAAEQGFDEIDRGECTTLRSPDEVARFVSQLGRRASDPGQ
jgi:antitoxin ParD1/3/4